MAYQETYQETYHAPYVPQEYQTQTPPTYAVSELYDASTTSHTREIRPSEVLEKPVVVPQSTNLFFIKTFSPFSRAYSPALGYLKNTISQDEFLAFIDGLNEAFLSPPVFQAMHVIGGTLLGTQIIPAQAVGGVFQITSLLGSAGFSIVRVKKYLKKTNASMFALRGLTVRLLSTKKMMEAINFKDTDAKGKMKLSPLEDVSELDPFIQATQLAATDPNAPVPLKEDPRLMRLKVLEDYVAPLTFDVPVGVGKMGSISKYGGAPLRWVNKKQMGKMDKARERSQKKRVEKAPEVQKEMEKSAGQLADLDQQIKVVQKNIIRASQQYDGDSKGRELQVRSPIEDELVQQMRALENIKLAEEEKRNQAIKNIHEKGDKKLLRAHKKEEKIANRILWVVIMKEGVHGTTSGDDLVHVDTHSVETH
ncbi:hypothetical protein LSUE1_G007386 [Lachnellula suecica]|uniref:Uncharacterized protein n=1 Tax=Lachnellula suecica TaxID=602035 RepID=A0A8T9BZV1_9HELO|nr:hypothetical protein LSUE1_G007386 [Lachnellula suecica]